MSWDIPPEVRAEGAGFFGSLIALLFVKAGGPFRKIGYFLAGWALAKFFGESVQGVIGTSLEAARALTGLFGLALVEKAFDVLTSFDTKKAAADAWDAVVKRIRGS